MTYLHNTRRPSFNTVAGWVIQGTVIVVACWAAAATVRAWR